MNKQEAISFLKEQLKEIRYMNSTLSVLSWDAEVMAPSNAISYRSEVMGYLSMKAHELITDSLIEEALSVLDKEVDLNKQERCLVEDFKDSYEREKKVPATLQRDLTMATSKGNQAWKQAKEAKDFDLFKPYLKNIVDLLIQKAEYVGYDGHIYNACLEDFEKGTTVADLDRVFEPLKVGLIELLEEIKHAQVPLINRPQGPFDKERQEKLTYLLLDAMGYDYKDAGRVDETEHPFTTTLGQDDVRITTHYYEDNIESALFSSVHEGGHAIYEQNMPHQWADYGINDAPSMGIHESQSRFYENIIGRSLPFWRAFYPCLQEIFPEYQEVTLEEFYRQVNEVRPSLTRTEADEVMYSLHIIIRYEIEKMLMNGEVTVDELPQVWNQLYEQYLGVTPSNDSEGLMQDVHWSEALIGYFPSYALGNLYGAQFYHKMRQDIEDLDSKIEAGDLSDVYNWLKENIHAHGKMYTPMELVERVTGETLNPTYFLEYLREKYTKIYGI